MANNNRREALRGAEEGTFDLLAEVLTSKQWAELLRAPLERAAGKGNRGLAQKLVGAGAEIGDTLHAAAEGGHGDVVNDLLASGASVAAKDTNAMTPLHAAAEEGTAEMVQLLLLKGANKDALDHGGRTPLHLAASNGHLAAALALLAAGVDVSLPCGHGSKKTTLHVAAQGGHVDIMRAVIERRADVDAMDSTRETPLHWALCRDEAEVIDVLVEAGANIEARNVTGSTPLHVAAFKLSLEGLLALLKQGAYMDAQNDYQETPLHWAAPQAGQQGAAEVVDALLRSGADETILDCRGRAAADVVGQYVEEEDQLAEDIERVHQLLANAPADRAWRRRGYLVLCRAHPDRMQQTLKNSSVSAGMAWRTRSDVVRPRTAAIGTAGGRTEDAGNTQDWAVLVARVVGLQEEGIFRAIVGCL